MCILLVGIYNKSYVKCAHTLQLYVDLASVH